MNEGIGVDEEVNHLQGGSFSRYAVQWYHQIDATISASYSFCVLAYSNNYCHSSSIFSTQRIGKKNNEHGHRVLATVNSTSNPQVFAGVASGLLVVVALWIFKTKRSK